MIIRSAADVGHLVRTHRVASSMSQQQLADALGTRQAWISEVEQGKPTVGIGRLLQLLAYLRIELQAPLPGEQAAGPRTRIDNSDLEYPDLDDDDEGAAP